MSEVMRREIATQIRCAAQLWSCDPDDCPLCDCGMDDEGRQRIHKIAESESHRIMTLSMDGGER